MEMLPLGQLHFDCVFRHNFSIILLENFLEFGVSVRRLIPIAASTTHFHGTLPQNNNLQRKFGKLLSALVGREEISVLNK